MLQDIRNLTPIEDVYLPGCLTILDDDYPKELFHLHYPPLVLYYVGNLSLLKQSKIGIVGSRKPCDYAIAATRNLARRYQDEVIVSGLAKGIDAIAHLNSQKTIGILGCGIRRYYPYANKELIDEVKKKGLLLSEYPGMALPLSFHFPFRNRIIAALAERIYVMQASVKSGTMTTVKEALELGKDIRVLPFQLDDQRGEGNTILLSEGAMVIDRDEIAFLN